MEFLHTQYFDFSLFNVFGVLILMLLIYYKKQRKEIIKYKRCASSFDGPSTFPYFGNSLEFVLHPEESAQKIIHYTEKYGSKYRLWIGGQLAVVIADANDAEIILRSSKCLNKGKNFHDLFGRGFANTPFVSEGDEWKKIRSLLQRPFVPSAINNYIEAMNDGARVLIKKLEPKVRGNNVFNVESYISSTAFYIACRTFFNSEKPAISEENFPAFKKAAGEIFMDSFSLMFYPKFIRKIKQLNNREKLKETMNILGLPYYKLAAEGKLSKKQAQSQNDVISSKQNQNRPRGSLIEHIRSDIFSTEHKESLIAVFASAGSESTATATCFTLLILGMHQKIQDKAYEELKGIFGDSDRDATMDDIKEMHYMEQVIKEVLRIYPLAPFLFRTPCEDITLGNVTIPSGTQLIINLFGLHKNPKYFPDPHEFNPENFSEERSKNLPKGCYLPFVIGARSCFGKTFAMCKMKILCSAMLRKYRIHSGKKISDVNIGISYLLDSIEGYNISISQRSNTYIKS